MSRTKSIHNIDFSNIKPEQVQRMLKDLYAGYPSDKREFQFGMTADRRQSERRLEKKSILLETRSARSRRLSAGRRQHDENHSNKHNVGIDYYI